MSHFDDFDGLAFADPPKAGCLAAVFLLMVVAIIVYCMVADSNSKDLCEKNGEKYIDSRTNYTLCEKPDGTVVRR